MSNDVKDTGYEEVNGPEHIELEIKISARYLGDRLSGSMLVTDTVKLVIPQMDVKYIVLPKVIEGAVSNIVDAHRQKVLGAKVKQDNEKKRLDELNKARANGFSFLEVDEDGVVIE